MAAPGRSQDPLARGRADSCHGLLEPEISGRFRSGDIRHCTADVSRARELLGYEPEVDWEAGLSELVEWARRAPAADLFERAEGELQSRGLVR